MPGPGRVATEVLTFKSLVCLDLEKIPMTQVGIEPRDLNFLSESLEVDTLITRPMKQS